MHLQIHIETVEPLAGEILEVGHGPLSFAGWLGLIEALSRLLNGPLPSRGRGGKLNTGGEFELREHM